MKDAPVNKVNQGNPGKATTRRKVENHFRLFHALLNYSDDSIEIVDMDTMRFLEANDGACRALGYTRDEFLSMNVEDIDPEFSTKRESFLNPEMGQESLRFESVHRRKDGTLFPVEVSIKVIKLDRLYGLAIARDITKRKQHEKSLKLFRALLDQSDDAIEIIDAETYQFIDVNEGASHELGYSKQELLSMRVQDIDPEFDQHREIVISSLNRRTDSRFETTHKRKDGTVVPVEVSLKRIVLDKPYHLAITRDIAERKRAENERLKLLQDIRHSASQLESIFAVQKDVILLYDSNMIAKRFTPQFKKDFGFNPIDMHLRDIIKRVGGRDMNEKPVEFGKNTPTPHALRGESTSGITFKVDKADKSTAIVEIYSMPYFVDDSIQGAVTVWHDVTQLMKSSDDLATYAKKLESAVSGTLQAVSKIVEQRDPYTAGHERRVGLIASDIAKQLGWPEEKCKELEMVGLVHDVGKVGVPAEILSKPYRLSGMELELVKEHVSNGYSILKDIAFPFPLAEIVLQHHERMDGSGYPQGLKGEEILIEARIIAVADTLEAIASHRPYRPALGLDVALKELTKNRGKLYDPLIVDTISMMIEEQGYRLPE